MREYKDPNGKFKIILNDTFDQRCELRTFFDNHFAKYSNSTEAETALTLQADKAISSKIKEILKNSFYVKITQNKETVNEEEIITETEGEKVPLTIDNVKASLINENTYFRLIKILTVDYATFFLTEKDE